MKAIDVFLQADVSRIAVIGSPGSGKSTFAFQVGQILDRKVVPLDRVLWQPGWVLPPADERKSVHDKLIAEDCWIIDGMWGSLVADRFARATTVIFLDVCSLTCARRAFWRSLKYKGKPRADMAEGCEEKFDREFLQYILGFPRTIRPKILQLASDNPSVTFIMLKGVGQTKRFVADLQKSFRTD